MNRLPAILIAALAVVGMVATSDRCAAQAADDLLQGVEAAGDTHKLGEVVELTFAVKNRGSKPRTFHFRSSKLFDIRITRAGKEVFRLSRGKAYAAVISNLTIDPGQTRSFTARWDQKDFDGNQVGPGAYKVHAQLTAAVDAPPATTMYLVLGRNNFALVPVTIKEAVSRSKELTGKKVLIKGTYLGWKPDRKDPNCKPGPPVTRNDWAVSDKTGCIYVTGPAKLDPANDVGARVTVVGRLQKTPKGQFYIKLDRVTVHKPPATTY